MLLPNSVDAVAAELPQTHDDNNHFKVSRYYDYKPAIILMFL